MSRASPSAAGPIKGLTPSVTVTPAAVAGPPCCLRDLRAPTGSLVSRIRPSTVRRAISRGTLCAPRQGEVGTAPLYSQLLIQPIMCRLPPGVFSQDTAA